MAERSDTTEESISTAGTSPAEADAAGQAEGPERPELLVAGAFAGGLALALVLKRIGRD